MESQSFQPVPPNPPAQSVPVHQGDRRGLAVASLVLGIVSLCLIWVPFVNFLGMIGCVVGLVLGILALKSSGKGLAIAGVILSALSLVIVVLSFVLLGGLMLAGPSIGNVFSSINSALATP